MTFVNIGQLRAVTGSYGQLREIAEVELADFVKKAIFPGVNEHHFMNTISFSKMEVLWTFGSR
jgi:hypothetical protein